MTESGVPAGTPLFRTVRIFRTAGQENRLTDGTGQETSYAVLWVRLS